MLGVSIWVMFLNLNNIIFQSNLVFIAASEDGK